jgi:hypothetical protein
LLVALDGVIVAVNVVSVGPAEIVVEVVETP